MSKKRRTGWILAGSAVVLVGGVAGALWFGGFGEAFSFDQMNRTDNRSSANQLVFAEQVTDEFGTYTRTYVKLPREFETQDGVTLDENGFEAASTAVKFMTLESIDSITLDTNRWNEWETQVAPKYISAASLQQVLHPEGMDGVFPVFLPSQGDSLPILVRDGGVRVADKRIDSITATQDVNGKYEIKMSGSALAYSSDEQAAEWLRAKSRWDSINVGTMFNADGTPMTKEQQAAYYESLPPAPLDPEYEDHKINATLLNFEGSFYMSRQGGQYMIEQLSVSVTNTSQLTSGNSAQLNARNDVVQK